MGLTRQQLLDNEAKIRAAMSRLLRGDIPPGGKCDVKTFAREAGIDRTAFTAAAPNRICARSSSRSSRTSSSPASSPIP